MKVKDLRLQHLKTALSFDGEKTLTELMSFFKISTNKSGFRKWIHEHGVNYKGRRIPVDPETIVEGFKKIRRRKSSSEKEISAICRRLEKRNSPIFNQIFEDYGLRLEIGKNYLIKDTSCETNKDSLFMRYEGEIIEEYDRYYLGVDKRGVKFTISKYIDCYVIKEI